jgi:hypothetical protein
MLPLSAVGLSGVSQAATCPVSCNAGWIYDPLLTPVNASSVDEQKLDPGAQPVAATDADVIWFKVFFSDKPQLQLTYLVSYERMGFVELTIHKADDVQAFDNSTALQAYPIDGSHTDAISVPKTSVFVHLTASSSIRTKAMAVGLPKAVGQGEYMVALRPQPLPKKDKFKLLGITSC